MYIIHVRFSLFSLISSSIYSSVSVCSQSVNINYSQSFGFALTPNGFGVAISTAVMGLHDKQRMFKKVNPGRGGLSCLQAGTWSTPALYDVVISRTNQKKIWIKNVFV